MWGLLLSSNMFESGSGVPRNLRKQKTMTQWAHITSVLIFWIPLQAYNAMFSESQKEHILVVNMDDKAYLRPGTDVGARNTKAGVIYDVCDPNEPKKLKQHDFNNPEVNQTPASFRLIKQHIENIQEKDELMSDQDQSLVINRPKYFIGSGGSLWASDYMRLSYEVPKLFQESP